MLIEILALISIIILAGILLGVGILMVRSWTDSSTGDKDL